MTATRQPDSALRRAWWSLHHARRAPREAVRDLLFEWPATALGRAPRWHARQAGVRLPLGPHTSPRVAQSLLFSDSYESAERELLERYLEPGDIVLELGTGLGLIATLAARPVGSDRVSTYEANPALIAVARETFRVNGVAPRLEACALGLDEGSMDFYVEPDFWSSSSTARSARAMRISVPVKPLDQVIAALEPSFMVVDIEGGGETELFARAQLGPSVRKLMIELHPHVVGQAAIDEMLGRLSILGFRERENMEGRNVLLARA